ncbi:porin [Methylocystis heyeri]|uniref:Porin n=1 Tax=Methylocystis heyeri TaxID=391905 RepID=A0A6B8KF47_9HYPH|nr:porin [Methylocystis heyeri]
MRRFSAAAQSLGQKLKHSGKGKPLTVAALSAFALLPTQAARADDTAAEIRELKKKLEQTIGEVQSLKSQLHRYEGKTAEQDRKLKEVRTETHKRKVADASRDVEPGKSGSGHAPLPFFIDLSHGLSVQSLDHADSFHLGGRIYVDGGGSTQPEKGLSETANLTQARLQVEGRLRSIWEYKFQYDFVGGSNAATVGAVGGIRDAYLALIHPGLKPPFLDNPIEIQIGNFYLPHGMERTGSKNYIDFIERSLMSDTFGAARHVGVAALTHGANWTFKAALSSTSVEDAALKPTADYPVPLWVPSKAGWISTGGSQYFDVTARATYAPIWSEDRLLHFGASGRYHRPNDSTAGNDDRVLTPGANTYMESNVLKTNLLGTPDLSCGAYGIAGNPAVAGHCVKNLLGYGLEGVAVFGPASIQAEYMNAQYNRDNSRILEANLAGILSPGGSSLNYSGYYVSGIYFLTGESKAAAYQVDNNSGGGSFRQIQIKHPLSQGGWGAWALTARYSEVDLNSGPYQGSTFANLIALAPTTKAKTLIFNSGVNGGREQDVTVGLNWYAEPGVRVMANWTRVMALAAPYSQPYLNGAHPNTFLVRTQIDW